MWRLLLFLRHALSRASDVYRRVFWRNTRSGLQNAVGIAGIMLTTQAVMSDKPEPAGAGAAAAAPAAGGMGGMGGMM